MKYSNFTDEKRNDIFFFLQDNMMLRKNPLWDSEGDCGKGDALWRTGFAYTVYKKHILKLGILSCFTKETDKRGREYIQGHRYPDRTKHGVSRDQITSALCSLKLNNNYDEMNYIIKGLRKKLSKNPEGVEKILAGKPKFIQKIIKPFVTYFADARITLDMLLWMKSLNGSKFWSNLFHLVAFVSVLLGVKWTAKLYKKAGLEVVTPEEHRNYQPYKKKEEYTEEEKKAFKYNYPMYAFHLFAWQSYTSPNCWAKRALCKRLLKYVDELNFVVRLLLGDEINREKALQYKPMTGIRWQNKIFKYHYGMTEVIEGHPKFESMYTGKCNELDRDMLIYLMLNNLNKLK